MFTVIGFSPCTAFKIYFIFLVFSTLKKSNIFLFHKYFGQALRQGKALRAIDFNSHHKKQLPVAFCFCGGRRVLLKTKT
jgi:hypothetical protein